ncbi:MULTISPECIES: hypothetical protein [Bradyrhizobium]
MELFQEIATRGMLPLHELFKRYEDGEFPPSLFVRLFLGQAAQQEADDGELDRSRLLGFVEATEDWFQDKMRETRRHSLLTERRFATPPGLADGA